MPTSWTTAQVLSLAPDESSRKNALALASPRKWLRLHISDVEGAQVLWGECQGSGAEPYRCQVAMDGPAYKCSCPSRKLPCKHSLGLFLIFAGQPRALQNAAPPDWVTAWLAKRAELASRQADKAEISGEPEKESGADSKAKTDAQARRALSRDKKIRAGLDDLQTWLEDLVRQGLAGAQAQPRAFWESAAARLVDAQAPGLARLVRALPDLASSGDGWQERMLSQIGRLVLALEGYRRIDSLPATHQADLRAVVGFTIKQEELKDTPGVTDTWLVVGRDIEAEAGLKTQRVWLWGRATNRPALVLSFAAGSGALDSSLAPGFALPADLVFYPGSFPLRAFVRSRENNLPMPYPPPASMDFLEATSGYAAALTVFPWLERFPLSVDGVQPVKENGDWALYDQGQRRMLLSRGFLHGWTLQALSGGGPVGVFGEWNGERLLPLSAWADDQFFAFPPHLL